jgi:hypothetical protein
MTMDIADSSGSPHATNKTRHCRMGVTNDEEKIKVITL